MRTPRPTLVAILALAASACVTTGTSGSPGSTASAPDVTTTETRTEVVCEYVRPSGSNIMERQCREVRRDTDGSNTRGYESMFRGPPPPQSR